ncbi:MAG: ABC transporter substrate-binding protein, partial [Candidatus Hydrogenedentes bacterium]|nr:ABC transporter substrate-binding protein [Candidatus Hydrogenedentota bacterium]
SNPFFTDRRVRRAMAHAYDRNRVLRDVSHNLYLPSNGIFDSEHWAHNPDVELIEFDLDRAAQLLDEAGWTVNPDDGLRYKTIDGKPVKFEFTISFPLTFADAVRMGEIYRADLLRIGVSFKNRNIENATFSSKLLDHDFQAFVATNGFSIDPDYWRNTFHTDQYANGRNYMAYSSKRVDELFELEVSEFDRDKRAVYFRELQAQIYEDQPLMFMWNYTLTHAFSKRMRGVTLSPSGVYGFYPGQIGWWAAKEP